MSKILELRTKRNTLWEQTKDFLEKNRGENGLVKAEAVEQYNKMAQEVKDLGAEIERLEQQAQIEAQLSAPTSSPVHADPKSGAKKDVKPTATAEYAENFWNMIRNRGHYGEVRNALSVGERAFITGDGVGKPLGLLAETGGAKVGVTAGKKDAVTFDEIFKLYYALKAPYRKKAQFLCNEALVLQLMTIKDNNGNYIWKPGLEIGKPDTLLNRPLKTSAFMPEIKGGSKVCLLYTSPSPRDTR